MKYLKVSELQANKAYVCRLSGNKMLVVGTGIDPARKLPSGDVVGPWTYIDAIMWNAKDGVYMYSIRDMHYAPSMFSPQDYQFYEEE